LLNMIRLSGSVKLRWAFGSGTAAWLPVRWRACCSRAVGFADPRQSSLPGPEFGRQLVAPGIAIELVLGGIDRLGLAEAGLHLRGKRCLALGHPGVAHRLVSGSVGLELRPIERDPAELDEAGFLAQDEDPEEEGPERAEVAATEARDRLVVRARLSGEVQKPTSLASRASSLRELRTPVA